MSVAASIADSIRRRADLSLSSRLAGEHATRVRTLLPVVAQQARRRGDVLVDAERRPCAHRRLAWGMPLVPADGDRVHAPGVTALGERLGSRGARFGHIEAVTVAERRLAPPRVPRCGLRLRFRSRSPEE